MHQNPNIVFILTDHFRPDVLTGPQGRKTMPGLMEIADRGTLFTNCYSASPLCQPARSSIITGLYPSQHGICGNQVPPIQPWLRKETFMNRLREAGYYTAMIGKHHYLDRAGMHMDVRDDYPTVKEYGFDHVFTVDDDHINLYNNDEYTQYMKDTGRFEEFKRVFEARAWECGVNPFPEDDTPDGFIGMTGEKFVREYDRKGPFYLNLSFIGPHPPYWHPGDLQHDPELMEEPLGADCPEHLYRGDVLYEAKGLSTRENRAHYMDKCSLIDRQIKRLTTALQEREFLENTVIIFTSDHGDNLGDYGVWDKRFFYEQSVGVPLIMAGPGIPRQERLNGARLSKALVTHLDLYPTMLDLARVGRDAADCSSRVGHNLFRPGRSLLATLADEYGGGPAGFHDAVFAELATSVMVRTAGWKLVFDPEQGGVTHLYNLTVDHHESENLAGRAGYEAITARLMEKLLAHKITSTQYTHQKEEKRLQHIRAGL
jgi:choline-sulfatase